MNVTVAPGAISGRLSAIPSKSQAHRLLICAALASQPTELYCDGSSEDILATVRCLQGLGAGIERDGPWMCIRPILREKLPQHCTLDCGESGTTLRFLLPVIGALGITARLQLAGRLPRRPLDPLIREMEKGGCQIQPCDSTGVLRISGQLLPGQYFLPGDISSQFVSGMLFALPLLAGESRLEVTPPVESADYIEMTLQVLTEFSVPISSETAAKGRCWHILPGGYHTSGIARVTGDWSNAAPWLCAGAIGGAGVTVDGLRSDSLQGDRAICRILQSFGAQITGTDTCFTAKPGSGCSATVDARQVPDLVPVLAAVAALRPGVSVITGASRLRMKESDRLTAVRVMLNALGGRVEETADGLVITGRDKLSGGTVDAMGDHRIAMAAAVASAGCAGSVTVTGAQAVNKSYPGFWDELARFKTIWRDV